MRALLAAAVFVALAAPAAAASVPLAPYVDALEFPKRGLPAVQTPGISALRLGFVTRGNGACTPSWEGSVPIGGLAEEARWAAYRAAGGRLIVSFGGADGIDLARTCADPAQLAAVWEDVIQRTGAVGIDLDVEGASLADAAAAPRRPAALALLSAWAAQTGRALSITLTLPADTDGLTPPGLALVNAAAAANVPVTLVNAMTMDFGGRGDDLRRVLASARAVHRQVAGGWGHLMLTVLIGTSDIRGESLSLASARKVAGFARRVGVGALGFWSLARDRPCRRKSPPGAPACHGVDAPAGAFTRALRGH